MIVRLSRVTDQRGSFCGWECSRLSRNFKWICGFIYVMHKHLLEDILDWHAQYLQMSQETILQEEELLHGDMLTKIALIYVSIEGEC